MSAPSGSPAREGVEDGPRRLGLRAARTPDAERGASGRASSAGQAPVSAHSLTWVDAESGEGLRLELNCDEAFAEGLASTGFVRVARVRPESTNEET